MNKHDKIDRKKFYEKIKEKEKIRDHCYFDEEDILNRQRVEKVKELSIKGYRVIYGEDLNDEKLNRYFIFKEKDICFFIFEDEVQPKSIRETLRNIENNKNYENSKK